jgi:hypothetical protein
MSGTAVRKNEIAVVQVVQPSRPTSTRFEGFETLSGGSTTKQSCFTLSLTTRSVMQSDESGDDS